MPTQSEIEKALATADEDYMKFQEYGRQIGVDRAFIDAHIEHVLAAALRSEKARADLMERQCLEWLRLVDEHGLGKKGPTERRLVIEMAGRHHTERAALGRGV